MIASVYGVANATPAESCHWQKPAPKFPRGNKRGTKANGNEERVLKRETKLKWLSAMDRQTIPF